MPEPDHRVEPVTPAPPELPRPCLMRAGWRDLSFVHWAVEPERVAAMMPPGVRPDVHQSLTYVGLVAFRMIGTRPPYGPAVPWLGTFLEINVRLYSVDETGRRGVVFLSMDTDRLPIVAGARAMFGLPYRWGRLQHTVRDREHTYEVHLRHPGLAGTRSRLVARAHETRSATTLDEFLLPRWGLHVAHLGRTWYLPVAHQPWTVHRAEVLSLDDGLLASVGLGELADRPPDHVAFSEGVDADFGRPVLASTPRERA